MTSNFRVIKTYKNSDSYAIGVGHLADRVVGRGFETGGADGVPGKKSRAATSEYQSSPGQEATGDPSVTLLWSLGG